MLTDRELFGATRVRRLTPSKRRRDARPDREAGGGRPGGPHRPRHRPLRRHDPARVRRRRTKEYLQLDFAGDDKIFLPADQIGRISRYSGGPGAALSRLGGTEWERTKRRVRRAVTTSPRAAGALRRARGGRRLRLLAPTRPGSGSWRRRSPTTETPDQLRAIEEVKADMERRGRWTAWSAATSATARPRSPCAPPSRPCRTASRWRCWSRPPCWRSSTSTPSASASPPSRSRVRDALAASSRRRAASEIVEGVDDGSVDILIGTHRILQKDVAFADLGLLIVDEEQRFGVAHKERLKQLRTRGGRADAVGDADPAHAAHVARRHPRHVASSRRRRRSGCRSGRYVAGGRRRLVREAITARARPRRAGLLRPQPGREHRGRGARSCAASCRRRASPSATARWRRTSSSG